jgi:hypothetical protein
MSNSLLSDFFNPVTKTENIENGNSIEFKPSPKKGQNGIFDAIIRFLPNPIDPNNKSIISKYSCYMTHPRTNEKREIDCPSSIGQQSILTQTFFSLRNSPNPILKENANQFSRKQRFSTIIQVLNSKSQPNLNGKILVWRFGYKVYEKIQAEMNPPIGEPKNPFNMLTGRPFLVRVKEVGGYPNYDSCQFFDLPIDQSGFQIQVPNATGQLVTQVVTPQLCATIEGQQAVLDYLQKNAPDMTPYEFHPWTEADTQFVNECVQIYSDPTQSVTAATQRTYGQAQAMPQNVATPMGMQFPTGQPMMQAPQQMPVNTAAPGMGLDPIIGFNNPGTVQMPQAPQPAAQQPLNVGGFTTELPEGLNDVLNAGTPSQPSAPANAPTMGLNLNDVLAGQMI